MYVRPKHPYIQNKNEQVIKRFENKHINKCMEIKQGDKNKERWVLVTVDEVFRFISSGCGLDGFFS